MKQLKRYTIIGVIFVMAAGTLAHFLYDWSNHNALIGLVTPINESVWEHMKLLFFPMLLYSPVMIFKLKSRYPCIASALCFGILSGTLLIPVLFYAYTTLLGKDIFVLDIVIFILSIVLAFLLACRLTLSCKLENWGTVLCIIVCILLFCFLRFTYHPLDFAIFEDPPPSVRT